MNRFFFLIICCFFATSLFAKTPSIEVKANLVHSKKTSSTSKQNDLEKVSQNTTTTDKINETLVTKESSPSQQNDSREVKQASSQEAVVVSENKIASHIGSMILKAGGNAIDAAVAVGYALSVLRPDTCGLGGGGVALLYLPPKKKQISINYRETAPLYHSTTKDDDVPSNLDISSHYAQVATPGTPGGLGIMLKQYGTMSIHEVLQPAIKLAKQGFPISKELAQSIVKAQDKLKADGSAKKIFFHSNGSFYQQGELFKQPELARSLELIASKGDQVFYRGKLAYLLSNPFKKYKNTLRLKDFTRYYPTLRQPLQGIFHGYPVLIMQTPSAGGIFLLEFLNIMERLPNKTKTQHIHLFTETAKYVYADYRHYAGDADFSPLPIRGLTSKKYAAHIARKINRHRSVKLSSITHGHPFEYNDKETSHFVIIDKQGNIVNNTFTLSAPFGSGIVPPYTGIVMNNSILAFNFPNNKQSLHSKSQANQIKPSKKMISFMSPAIVLDKKDKTHAILAIGTRGGSEIISSLAEVIINSIENKMDLFEAIQSKRIYPSIKDNTLFLEKNSFTPQIKTNLAHFGHIVKEFKPTTALQGIAIDPVSGLRTGVSDIRYAGSVQTTQKISSPIK